MADSDIIAEAVEFFAESSAHEAENRDKALKADLFIDGEGQWASEIKEKRRVAGEPCLTFNRMGSFANQITNDQRQTKHSLKALPVDDQGDIEVAEQLQGIFRNIEANSDAQAIYSNTFQQVIEGGWGYLQLIAEWVDGEGFDQDLLIKSIHNRFSVHWDPTSFERDGADAHRCLVSQILGKEKYKAKYPHTEMASAENLSGLGDTRWTTPEDDSARVSEFWKKDYQRSKLYAIMRVDAGPEEPPLFSSVKPSSGSGWTVVRERDVLQPFVMCYKTNGHEIIKKYAWPGQWIPVIPVYGNLRIVNGEKRITGIVHNSIDAQRMYNYWMTAITAMIALGSKAPWIGYKGQFKDPKWLTANVENYPFIEVEPFTIGNAPAPLPVRGTYEPAVQAMFQMVQHAAENLKATTGIFDASLGARTNETSGIAIQRRQAEGDRSNAHYADNLRCSMRHLARVALDVVPIYYKGRVARILGEDGTTSQKLFDPKAGRYDVVLTADQGYATKRQEGSRALLELVKIDPTLMQWGGDIVFKGLDVPGAQDLAERKQETMPPELLDDNQEGEKVPPRAKAMLRKMNENLKALDAFAKAQQEEVARLQKIIDAKVIESDSRENTEAIKAQVQVLKIQTDAAIKGAEIQSKELLAIRAELAALRAANAEPSGNGAR